MFICIYIYDLSEYDSHPAQNQNENQILAFHPKTFVGNEKFDGNMVMLYNFHDDILEFCMN